MAIRRDRKVDCPILDRLERRYPKPHWRFLREVRNDTGYSSSRSADALAVGMYHSRGQLLIGFEKKVSRSDWLKEMREPEKAEAICQFCDQWYIVVPSASIVGIGELPETWGLLIVDNGIHTAKQAPTLTPKPIDRGMLAAIVERTVEHAIKPYLISEAQKKEQDYSEAFERGRNTAAGELERLRELEIKFKEFEAASGVSINSWSDSTKIGEAVKAVIQHENILTTAKNRLSVSLRELTEDTVPAIQKSIALLNEMSTS